MNRFFFIILSLVFSLQAFAAIDSYKCFSLDGAVKVIDVKFEDCSLTPSRNYDICQVDEGQLVIGVNPLKSVLVSETIGVQEYSCREYNSALATPSAPTGGNYQQEQSPRPSAPARTATGGRAEPGHGGSNIRGRGIVNPEP